MPANNCCLVNNSIFTITSNRLFFPSVKEVLFETRTVFNQTTLKCRFGNYIFYLRCRTQSPSTHLGQDTAWALNSTKLNIVDKFTRKDNLCFGWLFFQCKNYDLCA